MVLKFGCDISCPPFFPDLNARFPKLNTFGISLAQVPYNYPGSQEWTFLRLYIIEYYFFILEFLIDCSVIFAIKFLVDFYIFKFYRSIFYVLYVFNLFLLYFIWSNYFFYRGPPTFFQYLLSDPSDFWTFSRGFQKCQELQFKFPVCCVSKFLI